MVDIKAKRIATKSGEELDVVVNRNTTKFIQGRRSAIKTALNKRLRKAIRNSLRNEE